MNAATPACPKCNAAMTIRDGRFGKFYGCTRYRQGCRGTKNIPAPKREAVSNAARVVPTGSPEQEAIWAAICGGTGHVCGNALAGTGKSFTAREAMHRVPAHLRQLYLCFGADPAREFRGTAPSHVTVSTLNAIGWNIVKSAFNYSRNADPANFKVADLFAELWQPATEQDHAIAKTLENAVDKLVALCQSYLADGNDVEQLQELALRHDVEITSEIEALAYDLAGKVLAADKARTGSCSFNDQVWFPVVHNLPCQQFDLIFVDEAQDLNAVQHALVLKLLAPGGRVVIIGDDNQAIFGFRGSDVDSIANLSKLLEQHTGKPVQGLPLSVSRRCAKSIIRVAQQWVPSIQALPDAPEGEVIDTDDTAALTMYQPGDMIVCRVNAPLASIAFGLIKRGVKAVIRGRDIGQGLLNLMDRMKAKDVADLLAKLEKWLGKELAKVAGTRREQSITQRLTDQVDCIIALSEDCDRVADVKQRVRDIFVKFEDNGAPKAAVVLSSIHKAKGLEAGRVFWFNPDLTCKGEQEWQQRQERNLKYVAATRAKLTLVRVYEKKAA
jgi:DNA helicase-2/ATP-dependent DNA helicase PcrA